MALLVMTIPMASPALLRIEEQKKAVTANLANVQKKIAVISGKGGVGKTFVATELALALKKKGFAVGILDADIDCPNVFVNWNIREPLTEQGGKIVPVQFKGIKAVSMAGFGSESELEKPRIWRGPLIGKAIADFLVLTDWGKLDFLIIDMPPGTSDASLTLMQFLSLDGVIVVGTSSPAAVLDAQKSALMAIQLNQPVLGLVENMSGEVFGQNQIKKLALELKTAFLGEIPLLNPRLRESFSADFLAQQVVLKLNEKAV